MNFKVAVLSEFCNYLQHDRRREKTSEESNLNSPVLSYYELWLHKNTDT